MSRRIAYLVVAALSTTAQLVKPATAQSMRAGADASSRARSRENRADVALPAPSTPTPSPREAPRAISARELENLVAFTRALGYVRFFHPGAHGVHTNWDDLAVRGIRTVQGAPTADSLASALRTVFASVAPAVSFARVGSDTQAVHVMRDGATHVIFWIHAGAGSPTGGPPDGEKGVGYSSVRVIESLDAVGAPVQIPGVWFMAGRVPRVPDPEQPLRLVLGGGVAAVLPVALYTRDSVVADSMMTAHPAPAREQFSADDRATRLADVALAWSLFQNFYPYFDVVHTDWQGALRIALSSAATDADADAFQKTLERLVAALHDGHGTVLRTTARPVAMPDTRLGWAEGRVVVTVPGDSGSVHGLQRGDVLLSVDGRPVDTLVAERSALTAGATPQWIRTRVLRSLLAGDPGTTVTLGYRDAAGHARVVHLTRSAQHQADEQRPAKIAEVAPGVMYVDLARITDIDFMVSLTRLTSARGIIFDGRGYPRQVNTIPILSHLADSTIHSAHFELPILTLPDQQDVGYVDAAWAIPPSYPTWKAHVAYLIGGGAISYAESTAGVVEAYHLADLVGEPTAGTNGNVNPFMLPGGYQVIWTGLRVVKRDGTPHHGVGVQPTVPVSPTIAGIRAGRDEVLERAIAIVSGTR